MSTQTLQRLLDGMLHDEDHETFAALVAENTGRRFAPHSVSDDDRALDTLRSGRRAMADAGV
jgi:hypothetical protein